MKKYYEIRLSGAGGQGLGLAGKVFSLAAINYGLNICQTQSYGPEARGGTSRTDLIISKNEILFPNCRELDILLAMNQESASKFADEVKEGGLILVDSSFVNQMPDGRVCGFELTGTSIGKFKTPVAANIIALGIIAALDGIFSLESWVSAIKETVPERFLDMNLKAFELGHKQGREFIHVDEGRIKLTYDRKQPL